MIKIIQGDVLDKLAELPDNSVHTCITSPPYWGLRDYGVAGQIGLEKTPEEYIAKMVQVFREVKRVLRDDGTLFLNLGDSYAGSCKGMNADGTQSELSEKQASNKGTVGNGTLVTKNIPGLKPKDLCGIPWRVALALQADGWWLRSDIIWAKPNPMPESVTDRPTKSHEYIFLLTKSQRYYYDLEAVREPVKETTNGKCSVRPSGDTKTRDKEHWGVPHEGNKQVERTYDRICGRNLRSVWTITTKGYAEAHFATFPPEIPERCIKAGTSEKGVCSKCGAGWVRVVEKGNVVEHPDRLNRTNDAKQFHAGENEYGDGGSLGRKRENKTTGWLPACTCDADVIPATVLDIFGGSGTSGQVAESLGRDAILIELNPDYIPLIKKRTHHTNLFSS